MHAASLPWRDRVAAASRRPTVPPVLGAGDEQYHFSGGGKPQIQSVQRTPARTATADTSVSSLGRDSNSTCSNVDRKSAADPTAWKVLHKRQGSISTTARDREHVTPM